MQFCSGKESHTKRTGIVVEIFKENPKDGSNTVLLPDLYFDSFSYLVAPFVLSAGGIV